MASDPTGVVSSKQELLNLINAENNTNIALNDVYLSHPVAVEDHVYNSKVVLVTKLNSTYTGDHEVYYNRINLDVLKDVEINVLTLPSLEDFLQQLGAIKGVVMYASEFEPTTIADQIFGDVGNVALVAKPGAVKWFGQVNIKYVIGLPLGLDTLHSLLEEILPSSNYLT